MITGATINEAAAQIRSRRLANKVPPSLLY